MSKFNPGTYEGSGKGYRSKVVVSVTLSEDRIENVKIASQNEVRGLAWGLNTTPVELYPSLIVEYQSLNIPPVTGADLTCAAILSAVGAALKAGGATTETIAEIKAAPGPKKPEYTDEERTVDVVVCGAGAGGLAAAIEAKLGGAEVLVIEKQGVTGGSTARSGGKLLGAGTKWQKKQGIDDNEELVYDYLMDVGNRQGDFMDADKTRYLVNHLNSSLEWLSGIEATVKTGVEDIDSAPYQPLTKPVLKDGVYKTHYDVLDVEPIHVSLKPWRVHNAPGGGGQTNGQGGEISTPLTLYYENDLNGLIEYNTSLREILCDADGKVTGIVAVRENGALLTVHARRGVVLATGGYARNKEMCSRYPVKDYFSTVPHGNIGEGLIAAEKIGAKNYAHPAVQVVYTSLTCGIGINDESGLIVNDKGERVVNEWSYQYTVSDALARSGSNCGWYITDGKEPYSGVVFGYKSAVNKKSRDPFSASIEGLAVKIGCDAETLKNTVDRYNELCAKGVDDDFGKPAEFMKAVEGPKFAALRLHPCVTVTFGGLETDNYGRVLKDDGTTIENLFAAGEVAGTGMYGTQYPTCGTSIGSALFFGRNAGRLLSGQEAL